MFLSLCSYSFNLDSISFFSVHPYIFFNQDHTSMTFIGFFATDRGDLVDPVTKEVFHKRILTPKLRNGLKAQQVTFMDDDSNNQ